MNVSIPTRDQLIHGVERVVLIFILACSAYLKTTSDPLSKASLSAAYFAGVTAVFQLVTSTLTNR